MGRPAVAALAFWLIFGTAMGFNGSPVVLAVGPDEPLLTIDHRVSHVSTIPAIAGETVQLYVREKVLAGSGRPVVLMEVPCPGKSAIRAAGGEAACICSMIARSRIGHVFHQFEMISDYCIRYHRMVKYLISEGRGVNPCQSSQRNG